MSKAILVQITVFEGDDTDSSNRVLEQFVHTYDGSYGFEVESMFEKLGRQMGRTVDPGYYD